MTTRASPTGRAEPTATLLTAYQTLLAELEADAQRPPHTRAAALLDLWRRVDAAGLTGERAPGGPL